MTFARLTIALCIGIAVSSVVPAYADDADLKIAFSPSLRSLATRLEATLEDSTALEVQVRLLDTAATTVGDADVVLTADAPRVRGRMPADTFLGRDVAFGADAMVIAHGRKGPFADAIAAGSPWFEALAEETIHFGRGDPESPLGLRALFVLDLAGRYYGNPNLAIEIFRPGQSMPGDVLVRRLEQGTLDAGLVYRSQATRSNLGHLGLPDEIDLGDSGRAGTYAEASVNLDGATSHGAPILLVALTASAPGRAARATPLLDILDSEAAKILLEKEGYVVPPPPSEAVTSHAVPTDVDPPPAGNAGVVR